MLGNISIVFALCDTFSLRWDAIIPEKNLDLLYENTAVSLHLLFYFNFIFPSMYSNTEICIKPEV